MLDPALASELLQLTYNSEVIDPCQPEQSHEDILADAIGLLCEKEGEDIGVEDLYEVIGEDDRVLIPGSLKRFCPRLVCVLDGMLNGNLSTNLVCDLFSGFNGSQGNNNSMGFNIFFVPVDFSTNQIYNNQALALTLPQTNPIGEHSVSILVNTLNCNNSQSLDIFETIQHEMIHADIYRRLFENYGWDNVDASFGEAFHQLVLNEYAGQAGQVGANQHFLMLEHYLDLMVNSLIELNGGVGTYDDFIGLVLNGFSIDILNYCGISLSYIQERYAHYQNFINQPGNLNASLNNC